MDTPLNKWSTTDDVFSHIQQRRGCAKSEPLLQNTTVLITGASSGIGKESARVLASQGAKVVLACRSLDRAKAAISSLTAADPSLAAQLECLELDLSNPQSVISCASTYHQRAQTEHWPPLRTLLLNGGVYSFEYSESPVLGFENTFATNHLGHFQLTQLFLPTLQMTPDSRVVVVASDSHYRQLLTTNMTDKEAIINNVAKCTRQDFSINGTYCSSKLCNVLFAKSLSRGKGLTVSSDSTSSDSCTQKHPVAACSLHPGSMIATGIAKGSVVANFFMTYIMSWFTKSLNQGAATSVLCCLLPVEELRGQYFSDCGVKEASALARQEEAQDALWAASEELLAELGT